MSGSDATTARHTYINLPVQDLGRTTAFFSDLGFTFDPRITDEQTTCMIISDATSVLLHVEPYFEAFTSSIVPDLATSREVVIGVSASTRDEVDDVDELVVAAGGERVGAAQDQGFMYMRAFRDLDGHQWSLLWFDPAAMSSAPHGGHSND